MKKNILAIAVFLLTFLYVSFVSADVVINEIMYNPLGADDYTEWVELYNNGTLSVDLTGWQLCEDKLVMGYVNKTDTNISRNTSMALNSSGYAVITDGGTGTYVYD